MHVVTYPSPSRDWRLFAFHIAGWQPPPSPYIKPKTPLHPRTIIMLIGLQSTKKRITEGSDIKLLKGHAWVSFKGEGHSNIGFICRKVTQSENEEESLGRVNTNCRLGIETTSSPSSTKPCHHHHYNCYHYHCPHHHH